MCPEDGLTGAPDADPYFAEGKKKLNHRGTETVRRIRTPCLCISVIKLSSYIIIQPPYSMAGLAQVRLVREAMRSGICMSLFQASRHALRMAS